MHHSLDLAQKELCVTTGQQAMGYACRFLVLLQGGEGEALQVVRIESHKDDSRGRVGIRRGGFDPQSQSDKSTKRRCGDAFKHLVHARVLTS